MSWYSRHLRQTATYWGPPFKDEFGDQVYPSAATMRCHWEERAQAFQAPTGEQSVSHAVVHCESNIDIDGFLLLGTVGSPGDSPRGFPLADRIQQVEKRPTLRVDVTVYVAFL